MPVVVITGASQGIGRAVAEAFAEEESDTRLALLSRSPGKLDEVAEACQARGAEAAGVFACDVTDDAAVQETAKAVLDRWGAPDVLVNNAGLFEPGPLLEMSPKAFREQVDVNLTSAFVVTRAFAEPMLQRGSGHLFFMASVASIKAYPNGGAYGPAKHGLLGLARNLREETKDRGLRVTAIIPGATYTPSWEGSGLPEERFMLPEDVAQVLLNAYRLSERSVVEEVLFRPQEGDI